MQKIVLLICFFASTLTFKGQSDLDMLLQKLSSEKKEDVRIDLFNEFLGNTAEVDPLLDMQNVQKILLYAQKDKDKIIEAMALSQLGYDYRAIGNTAKSLEYNLKANEVAEKSGNERVVYLVRSILAHIYKDQADYPKAAKIYLSSAESAINTKDSLFQCWIFSSLAQVYTGMNKLDSALMYAQRSYELCGKHDPPFLAAVLRSLGEIHGKMGNTKLAVSYFDMAINEGFRTQSPRWLVEANTELAKFYHVTGQADSSLVYAKRAILAVKNTAFSTKSIYAAKLLLDIYENTNSDSAIKYFKVYKAANDSLFSAKTIQQTQALKFEDDLRQQQAAAEKIKAEQERKANTQYAAIAIGLILFISFFILLSRSIIVNERWISFLGLLGLLIVFEFINLFFHPFIASVTNHSPVLMLIILVIIAALLIPLHHRLEHWVKHKLVEKNKKIRLAAAKRTIEKLEKNNT